MGSWEPTALFLQTQITHTSFRPRIRLEPTHTFHQLHCIKQLEGLEDSMSTIDLSSQFLIPTLMEISLYSLVIGTRPTTRYHQLVLLHYSHALCTSLQICHLTFSTFCFWYLQSLRESLDSGKSLAFPDGLLINGQAHTTVNGDQGQSFQKGYCSTFCRFQWSISTLSKLSLEILFML